VTGPTVVPHNGFREKNRTA